MDEFWLLGPEADVLDAYAAIHAVSASLALALRARPPVRNRPERRHIERQGRALVAVAAASARMFRRRDEPGFDIEEAARGLIQLMRVAEAREARGVPHDRLVTLPTGWPFGRLAITAPSLALAAMMRLRGALQDVVIHGTGPRRPVQLARVRDLERDLVALASALAGRRIGHEAALRRCVDSFAAAAALIGPADIGELLGGGARPARPAASTILTAGYSAAATIQ